MHTSPSISCLSLTHDLKWIQQRLYVKLYISPTQYFNGINVSRLPLLRWGGGKNSLSRKVEKPYANWKAWEIGISNKYAGIGTFAKNFFVGYTPMVVALCKILWRVSHTPQIMSPQVILIAPSYNRLRSPEGKSGYGCWDLRVEEQNFIYKYSKWCNWSPVKWTVEYVNLK